MKPLQHGATKAMTRDGRVVENLEWHAGALLGSINYNYEWNLQGKYSVAKDSPLDLFAYEEDTMTKIIPFDLEKAVRGTPVQYRNGKRLKRVDWHWFMNSTAEYCIKTCENSYTITGKIYNNGIDHENDLMLELDVETVEG